MDSFISHGGGQADEIKSAITYKVTSNSDLVVPRRVTLLPQKFYTYHDEHDLTNRKSWYLDRRCQISPKVLEEISQPVSKCVRPRKTWTLTAALRGKGEQVQLYMFTLTWPRSWAAKGYTSFQFGFQSMAEAQQWHLLLSKCIEELRKATAASATERGTAKRNSNSAARAAAQAEVVGSAAFASKYSMHGGNGLPVLSAKEAQSLAGDTYEANQAAGGDALGAPSTQLYEADAESQQLDRSVAECSHHLSGNPGSFCAMQMRDGDTGPMHRLLAEDSSDEEDAGSGGHSPLAGMGNTGGAVLEQSKLMERWVPYKQVNGLSVYYHSHSEDEQAVGGEYMVSAVVRGSPRRVLDVLMKGSANTTILGPARKVEVLEFTKVDDRTTKEMVRLTIEAPGWAGVFCAPREIVVERMCKTDESRCFVVMFNSSDDVALRSRAYAAKPGLCCTDSRTSDNLQTRETQEEATGQSTQRSIWKRPVQGSVSGAYTISCLNQHNLSNSSESLITCMVKVDLGGSIATNSWTGVLCDLVGWREAFLDRILMNVMLVRDEVEYRRFKVQPQEMMSAQPQSTLSEAQRPNVHQAMCIRRSMTMAKGVSLPSGRLHSALPVPGERMVSSTLMPRLAGTLAGASAAGLQGSPSSRVRGQTVTVPGRLSTLDEGAASIASHEPLQATGSLIPGVVPQVREGLAVLDYELLASLATLERKYWEPIHTEGTDAPYSVRGPTYLKDKKKVPAGKVQFAFAAMDLIEVPHVVEHVARFLPSVRESGMPFGIIINLIIPGNPLLGVVATFATEQHPAKVLNNPPSDPMEEGHSWQPFDFVMHKFYHGDDETRTKMLKLIPHIADGSWMIKSSVGTTPVILGKQLKTTYHVTPQYIEIDIDISANNVASYVTGLVRGATKSLVIDMGFVLEGTAPWELPETLLGALRLNHLDVKTARKINVDQELPLQPPRYIPDPDDQFPSSTTTSMLAGPGPQSGGGAAAGGSPKPATMQPTRSARSFEAAGSEAAVAVGAFLPPPPKVSGGGGGSSTEPGTPASGLLRQLQAQGVVSTPPPSTAFGMRHRGHARSNSNADSVSVHSALNATL